ncbi:MAG: phosphotransferase [Kiritimatiellae bacterium]|nr:phosphotransferase [Kiritimatiellia bacterium]
MLKKKYYTTPLIRPEERPPLKEVFYKKPTIFRVFWIIRKLFLLLFDFLRSKSSSDSVHKERAVKCRHFLETLGGMWIKIGQVLGMRSDLFHIEFCNELSQLQDQAFAFPSERSIEIIEENLGRPIDDVFDRFDPKPFAAASLSQVHKARLRKKQCWVAVKVQRPFAAEYFRYDFCCLSRFFGLFEFFDVIEHFHLGDMLNEVRQMMEEELDYRHEANNMKKFGKVLKEHQIYVPKVYFKYSTKVILVMEFLHGVFMSDYINALRANPHKLAAWKAKNDINSEKVARRLLHSVLRQLYEDLIFHGDLHPGNIVLLKKNKLAFIDFGSVGIFDAEFSARYNQHSRAIAKGEFSRAADLLLLTMGKLPVLDIVTVKKEIMKNLEKQMNRSSIKNLPFREKSISGNSAEMNQTMAKYKFDINWNLLKLGRTFGAIDQNLGILNPAFNYLKETKAYHIQAAKRKQCRMMSNFLNVFEKASDLSSVIMPTIMSKALQFGGMVNSGTRVAAFIFRLLSRSLFIVFLVSVWIYLYQHHNHIVDDYHEAENWFTNWIESIPNLGKSGWYLLLILLVIMNKRLKKFIKNLLKEPTRFPGDKP